MSCHKDKQTQTTPRPMPSRTRYPTYQSPHNSDKDIESPASTDDTLDIDIDIDMNRLIVMSPASFLKTEEMQLYLPTLEDREQIIEESLQAVREMLEHSALLCKNEDFHTYLREFIAGHLCSTFDCIVLPELPSRPYVESFDLYLEEMADDIIEWTYTEIIPPRSYETTFVRKAPNVEKIANKIQHLQNLPQPQQRTQAWYEYRHQLITASAASAAFGSQAAVNRLIYEKCKPFDPIAAATKKNVNPSSTLHWGQKYEPITAAIYEKRNKTRIADFGCIQHQAFPFLGASPDGINNDPESPLYGRMLEIKNIVNREITGIPKEEYWIQMQLQMEVCDLNECDFLETRFKEYDTEDDFWEDGDQSFTHTARGLEKGVLLWFASVLSSGFNGPPVYEYAPIGCNKAEFEAWEEAAFERATQAGLQWVKNIYWRLDEYSCVLVLRNRMWFNAAISKLSDVWNIIVKERESDQYAHRAPTKRKATSISSNRGGCVIKLDTTSYEVPESPSPPSQSIQSIQSIQESVIQPHTPSHSPVPPGQQEQEQQQEQEPEIQDQPNEKTKITPTLSSLSKPIEMLDLNMDLISKTQQSQQTQQKPITKTPPHKNQPV
jgi:putative phage-type endonuclease